MKPTKQISSNYKTEVSILNNYEVLQNKKYQKQK